MSQDDSQLTALDESSQVASVVLPSTAEYQRRSTKYTPPSGPIHVSLRELELEIRETSVAEIKVEPDLPSSSMLDPFDHTLVSSSPPDLVKTHILLMSPRPLKLSSDAIFQQQDDPLVDLDAVNRDIYPIDTPSTPYYHTRHAASSGSADMGCSNLRAHEVMSLDFILGQEYTSSQKPDKSVLREDNFPESSKNVVTESKSKLHIPSSPAFDSHLSLSETNMGSSPVQQSSHDSNSPNTRIQDDPNCPTSSPPRLETPESSDESDEDYTPGRKRRAISVSVGGKRSRTVLKENRNIQNLAMKEAIKENISKETPNVKTDQEVAVDSSSSAQARARSSWSTIDDQVIVHLKEQKQYSWGTIAECIGNRHTWQAVQMRYIRSLRARGRSLSEEEERKLKLVIQNDWNTRWWRIARDMGPSFNEERCQRKLFEVLGLHDFLKEDDFTEESNEEPVEIRTPQGICTIPRLEKIISEKAQKFMTQSEVCDMDELLRLYLCPTS